MCICISVCLPVDLCLSVCLHLETVGWALSTNISLCPYVVMHIVCMCICVYGSIDVHEAVRIEERAGRTAKRP